MNQHFCSGEHCITCSDEAVTVHVVSIDQERNLARVQIQDQQEEVDITLIEQLTPGDLLLVHSGVAMTRLEPEKVSEV
jgi:hydrogenase maturation factor